MYGTLRQFSIWIIFEKDMAFQNSCNDTILELSSDVNISLLPPYCTCDINRSESKSFRLKILPFHVDANTIIPSAQICGNSILSILETHFWQF